MNHIRFLGILAAFLLLQASALLCWHAIEPQGHQQCAVCALGRLQCEEPEGVLFLAPQLPLIGEMRAPAFERQSDPAEPESTGRAPPQPVRTVPQT